jgi:hypothetical protein
LTPRTYHADLAYGLDLVGMTGQQRPRRMGTERHADYEQRHDGAKFSFFARLPATMVAVIITATASSILIDVHTSASALRAACGESQIAAVRLSA